MKKALKNQNLPCLKFYFYFELTDKILIVFRIVQSKTMQLIS